MKLEKADYGTIIQFGNMQDFNLKLLQEGKTLSEVIDIKDKAGMSLLEKSLVAKNVVGTYAKLLKEKSGIGAGFVDGNIEIYKFLFAVFE